MIKKWIIIATTAMLFANFGCASNPETEKSIKIALLSDIHILAPSLTDGGEAAKKNPDTNVRMVEESAALFSALIDRLIADGTAMVLISGDLTNNGERASHEYVAAQLARLTKAGIKALVVPGNHDNNTPYAKRFVGETTEEVATITRKEFAEIYKNFGYDNSVVRDTASLSFVAEPFSDLVVIGIDSNCDEQNLLKSRGDSKNQYHTEGRIKPQTATWIAQQAREAKRKGKKIVAMMHHHLIEHFDGETQAFPKYIIADAPAMRDTLVAAGVNFICTGHLHIGDIARDYTVQGDSITELASGSLCAYPFYYRSLTYDKQQHTLHISTHQAADSAFLEEGKKHFERALPSMVKICLKAVPLLKDHSGAVSAIESKIMPVASKAFVALVEGNEGESAQAKEAKQKLLGWLSMASLLVPDDEENTISPLLKQMSKTLRSLLEDRNHVDTPHEVVVNDHTLQIQL